MMNSKQYVGLGLIVAGLLFVMGMFVDIEGLIVLGGSVFFLLFYFKNGGNSKYRNLGLLIPGLCLLFATGFIVMENLETMKNFSFYEDIYATVGISLVFFIIFIGHTFWFKFSSWGKRYWPLFVVGGCSLATFIIVWEEYLNAEVSDQAVKFVLAIGLIGYGILLVLKGRKKDQLKKQIDE